MRIAATAVYVSQCVPWSETAGCMELRRPLHEIGRRAESTDQRHKAPEDAGVVFCHRSGPAYDMAISKDVHSPPRTFGFRATKLRCRAVYAKKPRRPNSCLHGCNLRGLINLPGDPYINIKTPLPRHSFGRPYGISYTFVMKGGLRGHMVEILRGS